jgi:hypothetical protein
MRHVVVVDAMGAPDRLPKKGQLKSELWFIFEGLRFLIVYLAGVVPPLSLVQAMLAVIAGKLPSVMSTRSQELLSLHLLRTTWYTTNDDR